MDEGERKNADVAREYRTDDVVVYWEPRFCMHSARCLQGLPAVFDVRRRPWVAIAAESADDIARVVATCPSGALSFERLDGAPQESVPEVTAISPWPDGPLFLRGHIAISDASGDTVREATRVALCRCGGSANKPFCDGTHRTNGFRAP
jgi:uncharacterized Fe-S cluster protein YjdI